MEETVEQNDTHLKCLANIRLINNFIHPWQYYFKIIHKYVPVFQKNKTLSIFFRNLDIILALCHTTS